MKMGLLHTGLLFLLFPSVFCDQLRGDDGEGAYERGHVAEADGGKTEAPVHWTSRARKYPEFVIVSADQTKLFKPEKGVRPLPESVKKLLLRPDAFKHLKLGSCPVNHITKDHYCLMYSVNSTCGFKMKSIRDFLIIGIGLSYNPATSVVREMPFDIKLQCQFPRFFHSYKIGFDPKLQGGTVYRQLQSNNMFTLAPQDESGNDVTGLRTYMLGQPMVFQARGPDRTSNSGNQRLYIHKCFMTTSANPNTNTKYTVIDNQGCMIDSKVTRLSKFVQSNSRKTQIFQVAAFIFKLSASTPSSQRLYMHCQVTLGPLTPTRSFKACTYCPVEKIWKELYGSHSVCSCCEATCPSAQPRASKALVSSHSWKVGTARSSSDSDDDVDEGYEINPTKPHNSDPISKEEHP